MTLITKGFNFSIPIRPKYFRKRKWKEKGIKEGWWITAEKLNELYDHAELKLGKSVGKK